MCRPPTPPRGVFSLFLSTNDLTAPVPEFLFFLGTPGPSFARAVSQLRWHTTLRAQVVHSMDGPPRQPRLGNLTVTKPVPNFLRQFQATGPARVVDLQTKQSKKSFTKQRHIYVLIQLPQPERGR